MDYTLASEVFPLALGKSWVYTTGVLIFTREVSITVADRINNRYLVRVISGDINVSAVVQSDVDMSIVAVCNTGAASLADDSSFEFIPKIELLKGPIMQGAVWNSSLGQFNVVNTDFSFKVGGKTYQKCIYIRLKDTSGTYNDIYIKPGLGIVFATLFIDGLGKISLDLKSSK